jgi:ATP-binding cassette subfamily F protein uup
MEAREYDQIEATIATAESELSMHQQALEDPAVTRDPRRLEEVYAKLQAAQTEVDRLYERWAELEAKKE